MLSHGIPCLFHFVLWDIFLLCFPGWPKTSGTPAASDSPSSHRLCLCLTSNSPLPRSAYRSLSVCSSVWWTLDCVYHAMWTNHWRCVEEERKWSYWGFQSNDFKHVCEGGKVEGRETTERCGNRDKLETNLKVWRRWTPLAAADSVQNWYSPFY